MKCDPVGDRSGKQRPAEPKYFAVFLAIGRGLSPSILVLAPQDDDMVFLCEVYSDAAALETRLDTPYMKQDREDTGPMVAERKRNPCDVANGCGLRRHPRRRGQQ